MFERIRPAAAATGNLNPEAEPVYQAHSIYCSSYIYIYIRIYIYIYDYSSSFICSSFLVYYIVGPSGSFI